MAYRKPKNPEPYPPVPDYLLAEISHLSGDFAAKEFDPIAFPGYVVTENGQIWSVRKANSRQWGKPRKRVLNPYPKGGGFLTIALQDEHANLVSRSVSRIVALAFIGEPPQKDNRVIHEDGNVTNNHVSNLRWATWEEFGENKAKHEGMAARGEQITRAGITADQAREIAKRLANESDEAIASDYGVGRHTVQGIRTGLTWKHIKAAPTRTGRFPYGGERSHYAKLTEKEVLAIRQAFEEGVSQKEIASRFGVHPTTVNQIIHRVTWRNVK
jgi:predicted DNA-binding protein (UPF0251 family)